MSLTTKRSNPYATPCIKGTKMRDLSLSTVKRAKHNVENMDPQLMFETPRAAPKSPFSVLNGMVVEVEGNIASGKSTLTLAIKKLLNTPKNERSEVFAEQVNNTFLGAFYSDTKRFSFAFQMYMLTTRLYQVDEASRQAKDEGRFVMLDRGAVGDAVFATLNHELGNMDEQELNIYKSVCQQRSPNLSAKVDLVLYLDVDPSECYRRVHSERKNDAEESIPLAYLEGVDKTYFHVLIDWMANVSQESEFSGLNVGPPPPFCVLTWTEFGTTHDALTALEALAKGQRRSPQVNFVNALPETKNAILLSTTKDVKDAFESLSEPGSTISSASVVYVNWELEHDRAFRRTIMMCLSQEMDVTLYRPSQCPTQA